MSPRRCTIDGCFSVSGQVEHQSVTFHSFPLNMAIRKIWIENCKVAKTKTITKSILVCSRHFRRADFQPLKNDKYLLRQGVVPTIFPWGTLPYTPVPSSAKNSGDRSNKTGETSTTPTEDTPETVKPKPATSTKAEKQSALKHRSVSADEHLATPQPAVEKGIPRKSLDSASSARKDITQTDAVAIVAATDQVASKSTKKPMDFITTYVPGSKLEAQDFNEVWHNAKVMEVDQGEQEVLIHFEKDQKVKGPAIIDEWIPMNSSRLRPIEVAAMTDTEALFKVGEKCLARWTDSRKFPATVRGILENNMFEVLFDDGFVKVVKASHMTKFRRPATPVANPQPAVESPILPPAPVVPTPSPAPTKKPLKIQPIPKFDLSKITMPEIPSDGEWCCQWVNDVPIGREGYLNNADGNKRPTVLVDDWRLPVGWTKHLYQRSSVSGKWDVVLVGPTGKRFRSKNDVKVYLEDHGQVYNPDVYDFSIHKRRAKDLGVYVHTDDYVPPTIPKPHLDLSATEAMKKVPLDTSLDNKQEVFTGFAPIDSSSTMSPALIGAASLELPESASALPTYPAEEGYIYVGALKVQIIDNLFRCPKQGCYKNFRKENHLQIHVKHYHDELSKQLGACPNMTELAYFRTVGNSIEETTPAKMQSPTAQFTDKLYQQSIASPFIAKVEPKEEVNVVQSVVALEPRTGDALKRKPDDTKNDEQREKKQATATDNILINSRANVSPVAATAGPSVEPAVIAAKKSSPTIAQSTNVAAAAKASNAPLRKFKIRKPSKSNRRKNGTSRLKKFKRDFINNSPMLFSDRPVKSDTQLPPLSNVAGVVSVPAETAVKSLRLKFLQHPSFDGSRQILAPGTEHTTNPRYINENGEMIKIVRMRQEEIINCLCTFGEEDGLMIQCELCLCWQHGICNGIEKESQVPEKYVCYICKNPTLGRQSMKYVHDQEWLYEGRLAHANYHLPSKHSPQRFDILKQSHTLLGNMLEMKKSLYSLNVKINIAANKDHPKMYLWSKIWDDVPVQSYRNLNTDMGQDQVVPKSDQTVSANFELKTIDQLAMTEMGHCDDTILKADGDNLENDFSKRYENSADTSILNNLLTMPDGNDGKAALRVEASQAIPKPIVPAAMVVQQHIRPHIPEPEAAIDPTECQRRLLEHIQKQQNLILSRMQMIDAQIIALEAMDEHSDNETNDAKTVNTIQMLLDNLGKLRKLSLINQSAAVTNPNAFN